MEIGSAVKHSFVGSPLSICNIFIPWFLGVPDTSRYQYDETSGYYFDPASGLYYDSNTQYFYDAEKQQFLHWSPEDKKYVAVSGNSDGDCSEKADILNGDGGRRKGKKSEKSDKVKVAKRIAKASNFR